MLKISPHKTMLQWAQHGLWSAPNYSVPADLYYTYKVFNKQFFSLIIFHRHSVIISPSGLNIISLTKGLAYIGVEKLACID